MNNKNYSYAKRAGAILKKRALFLTTAESCTGGLLAAAITEIPGSSNYFERGFVVYSNLAKKEALGVKNQTLKMYGAVSKEVAIQMAKGALKHSLAQISIAITGVAGPIGGTKKKPVGMVCIALVYKGLLAEAITKYFKGNRHQVREQAVSYSLRWLLEVLSL